MTANIIFLKKSCLSKNFLGRGLNIFHSVIFSIVFTYLFFNNLGFALANGATINYYTDPTKIIAEVSKRGARVVVSDLYSHQKKWNFVVRNIATGSETWLRVAIALHPGTDAGASEMLVLALGEALENAPENVFRIAPQEFHLESICSAPDADDVRYNSYELSIKAIKRRQNRIATISIPDLKSTCVKCIKFLDESKDGVAKFYGFNKSKK